MLRYFAIFSFTFLVLGADTDSLSTEIKNETELEKETAKLRGTWEAVSVEVPGGGKRKGLNDVLLIENGIFTLKRGEKVVLKGPFTIDPSKSPKTMDITITVAEAQEEAVKGKVALCVFELDKGTLTWCMADPSLYAVAKGRFAVRPLALAAKEPGQMLFTFKKSKR